MTFELGVYSFGNTPHTADGSPGNTAQAIRNVLEAVRVAEDVGLDFFGFGEHHTASMPLSSPTSLVTAAAASTQRIGLGPPSPCCPPTSHCACSSSWPPPPLLPPGASRLLPAAAPPISPLDCLTSTSATTTCSTAPSSTYCSQPTPPTG